MFYFVAIFADFFAPVSTNTYIAEYAYAPPQTLHLFRDGQFAPFVNGYTFERDPVSFKKVWTLDEDRIIPVGLFVRGEPYKMWGFIESDIHLIGPVDVGEPFFLMGADKSGQDVFSRMIFSSRVSLSIGLVGVFLSLALGITLGGISGLVGGFWDNVIQRLIEITMSIPTLPIIIAIMPLARCLTTHGAQFVERTSLAG